MNGNLKLDCYKLPESFDSTMASIEFLSDAKEFLRSVMYPGKKDESFVDTRIRMYENQKTKSSSGLIPDENSATQHVRRSCRQSVIFC